MPPSMHACAGLLWAYVLHPSRMKPNLSRPSGAHPQGRNLGKPALRGFPPTRGGGCWKRALPEVRHIMQGSMADVGHAGARIPEAHGNVLIAGPAVSLVVPRIRGG